MEEQQVPEGISVEMIEELLYELDTEKENNKKLMKQVEI